MITQDFIEQNFPKGKLTLIGGRPSMGKTSLLTSLALNLALVDKYSIYLSLEMNNAMLVNRIKSLCETSYKDSIDKIYIDDTPRMKLGQIRNTLNTLSVDYVFIDYIQLMETDRELENRNEELNEIVQELKSMANDFNLPIIASTQIRRRIGNTEIRPNIDDIYWIKPNSMENVNIIMLHRAECYHFYEYYPNGKRIEGKAELIRYSEGKELSSSMFFNKETTEFSEWLNWEHVKEEILNYPRWIIHLDENDVKSFEAESPENVDVLEAITEDNSENRFNILWNQIFESLLFNTEHQYNKILMYIQFPLNAPIMMSEMSSIQELIDKSFINNSECEIKWGLSPREDNISRIVLSFK